MAMGMHQVSLKQATLRCRHLCVAACATLLLAACADTGSFSSASSAPGLTPPPNFTPGLTATIVPQPLYPLRARSLGLEGWVQLSFSVDANGSVIGNTIETVEERPVGYFGNSATNAARRMRFQNNQSRIVEDVRYAFRYELEDQDQLPVESESEEIQFRELIPRRYITPRYPESAEEQGIEGFVVVNFTVTPEGTVREVQIEESEPPGVFDSEAIEAALRLRFEPRIVFDLPVTVEDVSYRFEWNLPR